MLNKSGQVDLQKVTELLNDSLVEKLSDKDYDNALYFHYCEDYTMSWIEYGGVHIINSENYDLYDDEYDISMKEDIKTGMEKALTIISEELENIMKN